MLRVAERRRRIHFDRWTPRLHAGCREFAAIPLGGDSSDPAVCLFAAKNNRPVWVIIWRRAETEFTDAGDHPFFAT